MPKIKLTNEEYNLLNNITSQTKTDCWFWLSTDDEGFDCVEDLENNCKVNLEYALQQLNEAIIPDLMKLTPEEIAIYGQLMQKLNLNNPFKGE